MADSVTQETPVYIIDISASVSSDRDRRLDSYFPLLLTCAIRVRPNMNCLDWAETIQEIIVFICIPEGEPFCFILFCNNIDGHEVFGRCNVTGI